MDWVLPLLLTLFLIPAVGEAETPTAPTPEVRGYWLRPVSEALGACEKGSASWGWSYKRGEENILYQVDSKGERSRVDWRFPEAIQGLRITKNCRFAWSVCRDRNHLFVIDSSKDRQPVGLVQESAGQREIWNVIASEDGQQAWLIFREEPYVMLAERSAGGIVVRPVSGLPKGWEPGVIESALEGDEIWVTSRRMRGLYLLNRTGAKRYNGLPEIEWGLIGSTHEGKVLWMVPRIEKGLYAVTQDGSVLNGGVSLLPDEDVIGLKGRQDNRYAWVFTRSGRVYAFRTDPVAAGGTTIVPLNGGKPVAGDNGKPLEVDALMVAVDGYHAWAMPPRRYEAYSFWRKVWGLEVLASGEIRARQVDSKLYEDKPIGTIYGSSLQPDQAWVKTHDMSVYEIGSGPDAKLNKIFDLATTGLLVEAVIATDQPGRLWIEAIPHGALMGPATDLKEATVSISGAELSLDSTPDVLEVDLSKGPNVTLVLDWPMARVGGNSASGTVGVRLFELGTNGPILRAEVHGELVDGKAAFRLPALSSVQPLNVELSYRDHHGSHMAILWNQVTFRLPWFRRLASQPWFRGLLILILPTVLLLLSLRRSWAVRSWVPVLVPGAGLVAAKAVPDWMAVTWLELFIVALMLMAATLVIGLLSPSLFRELATLQPFQALVPMALKFRAIRKKVFANYLTTLEEGLRRSRALSLGESYVAVPVRVAGGGPQPLVQGKTRMSTEELCGFLMAPDPGGRACLYIEAPGGRGKSALLHELLECCIDAFRENPLLPLPVIGDLRSSSVEEAVRSGLGRYGVSDALVRGQLYNGDFTLFLDGLSEAQLAPSQLEAFLQGGGGDRTRLCMTTRPSASFRQALDKADRWFCLEPQRLNRSTVQEFVSEYARADAEARNEDPQHALERAQPRLEHLLPICQAGDGTFLPLLVRWCMIALEQNVRSTDDLYRVIIEELLQKRPGKDEGDLWNEMEDLCYETYWEDRQRTFLARRPMEEQTRTVEELLKAGILIGVNDWSARLLSRPKQVRFFHDSVQSYLTARALDRRGDWEVLFQAAGDPDFCKASSDLFDGGAELFWMCLQVFEPARQMRQVLEKDLRKWADELRTALSIDDVDLALAHEDKTDLPKSASSGDYLNAALDRVVARDTQNDGAQRLGRLYSRLAAIAWKKQFERQGVRYEEVA